MDELADIASTRLVAASEIDKVLCIVKNGHYVFEWTQDMLEETAQRGRCGRGRWKDDLAIYILLPSIIQ